MLIIIRQQIFIEVIIQPQQVKDPSGYAKHWKKKVKPFLLKQHKKELPITYYRIFSMLPSIFILEMAIENSL
ncbi:MAG: hypothetical protein LUG18_04220 [Candidatus Azobacteroides sp.]|nr:hypothetical protein [Candidatus Azobacteroides sp.]